MLNLLLMMLENEEDHQRFIEIYNKCNSKMLQVALCIVKERKTAEDAVQNAWIKIIKNFEKIDSIPCDKLMAWSISIVRNETLMLLRKNKREVLTDEWEMFEKEAENESEYTKIVELFSKLPDTYKTVLEMRFLQQYQNHEISKHLGLSETVVSTRINRGRKLLQALIKEELGDDK